MTEPMRISVVCEACGEQQPGKRLSIEATFWCWFCRKWRRPVDTPDVRAYNEHHWPDRRPCAEGQ